MTVWTLAKKEFRLLARDRLSAAILLGMPLLFILLLGLLLGEGFGQKTDNRLRISLVSEDRGYALAPEPWSKVIQRDLAETAELRVEVIDTLAEAEELVRSGRRAAILYFGPTFSERVHQCSFLKDGINPFFRDGVDLNALDARLIRDPSQLTASSIIDQVGQVSLLRVILPWMIGRAFERLSDPAFIDILGGSVTLPVPKRFQFLLGKEKMTLQEMLDLAADSNKEMAAEYRQKVGSGVQSALAAQFPKYNLTGKTWASLTKADPREGSGASPVPYREEGVGWLKRGAARYQILVPSYTVLFSFSLVLTVGWLFDLERRQGTGKRLRAAPVGRAQIILGKFLPCFAVSVFQGLFLLIAGKLIFGMSWGPPDWPLWRQTLTLLPVVMATSLAAMGLALLGAAVARSAIQVVLISTLLVLLLGLLSGCLVPRELMPETMMQVSQFTPQAWALDAYRELLVPPDSGITGEPNLGMVWTRCGMLSGFGVVTIVLAWVMMRLE